MEFGISVQPSVDCWKTVKRAEELGIRHAWFVDSPLVAPDMFMAMALAAEHTSRIKLGTGLAIASNRIPPVLANCLATLNKLAPGRVVFGVGAGFTSRYTMGVASMRLADLREYIEIIYALLRGEVAQWDFEGARRKISFLNPEIEMINLKDRIPLYISAFNPKAKKLTGEIADGWITFPAPEELASQALHDVVTACREAGRDPNALRKTIAASGCILQPGESATGPRAKKQAGPFAAARLHGTIERSVVMPTPELQKLVAAYKEQYAGYQPPDAKYIQLHKLHHLAVRPEEEKFITEELIRYTTFTGTADVLLERLRRFQDIGFDTFTAELHSDPSALEDWAHLFEKV